MVYLLAWGRSSSSRGHTWQCGWWACHLPPATRGLSSASSWGRSSASPCRAPEVPSKLPLRQLLAAFRNEALAGPGKEDDSEERERMGSKKVGYKREGGQAGGRSQVGACTAYCTECDQCTLARSIHPSVFVPPLNVPLHFSARVIDLSFNFSLLDPFFSSEKGLSW